MFKDYRRDELGSFWRLHGFAHTAPPGPLQTLVSSRQGPIFIPRRFGICERISPRPAGTSDKPLQESPAASPSPNKIH